MKKIYLLIFSITIVQVFSSCKTQYSTVDLEANFSNEQLADLKKITDFFTMQMCLNADPEFKSCYEKIPHDYLEVTGEGFWTNINFEEQIKLYDQISNSTFNEIWSYCESTYYPSEIKAKDLCAASGKYQKYLADIGKTNPYIARYAKLINASGDFGGFDLHYRNILNNDRYFDLNDPNIQLILAIHYLTLNDKSTRNADLIERR